MNLTVVIIGFLGLYFGGTWLVNSTSRLALSFGVSQLVLGLTVVTLITASPELISGITATNRDAGGMVLGTVVGANIVNLGLILGVAGLVARNMTIATGMVRRGIPIMIAISFAVYGLLFFGTVDRLVGSALIIAFAVFIVFMVIFIRRDAMVRYLSTQEMQHVSMIETQDMLIMDDPHVFESELPKVTRWFEFLRFGAGVLLLLIGSNYIVKGAIDIAQQLDANEIMIGATLVALATSLPEMLAVTIAVRNERYDAAVGNLIGSSVANLLLVVGITSFIQPLYFDERLLRFEFPVMLVFVVATMLVAMDRKFMWWEAMMYAVGYFAFLYMALFVI